MSASRRYTFLSCDWGSSSFRLRLARRSDATVLAEVRSDRGASAVGDVSAPAARSDAFAAAFGVALSELAAQSTDALSSQAVVVSGMATSAHGWRELPYASAPCALDCTGFVTAADSFHAENHDCPLIFVSGVRTENDVMRGEECELAGLLRHPQWSTLAPRGDAVVVLPGTHSKHAHVVQGRLVRFRTFMTGELFDVLGRHSVLRRCLDSATAEAPDPAGLAAGVASVRTQGLAATLFRVRTAGLLHGASPTWCRGFLSGALVAAELETLRDTATPIVLCAGPTQAPVYHAVFAALDLQPLVHLPPTEVATLTVRAHAAVLEAKQPR